MLPWLLALTGAVDNWVVEGNDGVNYIRWDLTALIGTILRTPLASDDLTDALYYKNPIIATLYGALSADAARALMPSAGNRPDKLDMTNLSIRQSCIVHWFNAVLHAGLPGDACLGYTEVIQTTTTGEDFGDSSLLPIIARVFPEDKILIRATSAAAGDNAVVYRCMTSVVLLCDPTTEVDTPVFDAVVSNFMSSSAWTTSRYFKLAWTIKTKHACGVRTQYAFASETASMSPLPTRTPDPTSTLVPIIVFGLALPVASGIFAGLCVLIISLVVAAVVCIRRRKAKQQATSQAQPNVILIPSHA